MSTLRNRLAGLGRRAKVLLAIVCIVLILGVVSAGVLATHPRLTVSTTEALPGLSIPPSCEPELECMDMEGMPNEYYNCLNTACP